MKQLESFFSSPPVTFGDIGNKSESEIENVACGEALTSVTNLAKNTNYCLQKQRPRD